MEEVRSDPPDTGKERGAVCAHQKWRRRVWFLLLVPVFVLLALAYLHFTSPPPELSVENVARIREGMTELEVEGIVGARSGGYGIFWGPGHSLSEEWGKPVRSRRWSDETGYLTVGFGADGRVCKKVYQYHPTSQRPTRRASWWEKLIRRSVPGEPGIAYISF
jgi:hypothetical protein